MGRRTSKILDRAEVACLVLLVVATPTVFLRSAFSTFDAPQLTILWLTAITLGLLTLARWVLLERGVALPRPVMVAAAVFLVSLGLNVAFSAQPWVTLTGLPVRGAGVLTYGLCLVVLFSAYRIAAYRGPAVIVRAFVAAHVVVAGYALLQAYGGDPYQWGKGEIWVSPVFSTLGNPNFSAAYLAVTLPLVTWLAFGSTYGRGARVLGGALLGATTVALSYLNSFQGDVAALASVAVAANWAWYRGRGGRLVATAVAAPATLAILGVPLLLQEPGRAVLVALVACLATTGWLSQNLDMRHTLMVDPVAIRWTRRRVVLVSSAFILAVTGTVLVAGGRIIEELRSGLEQRVEFWRTSLSIFREHPIVGTGLETYPAYFTLHRPVSHAVEWEFVLSDSPHSVPLGLLSGGGLLVAGSYAALVGLIGWIGYRATCRTGGSARLLTVAILTAWVAYQVQSLVSIDVPGLAYTHWVLGGMLLAGGAAGDSKKLLLPRAKERDLSSLSSSSPVGVTRWRTLGVVVPVVSVLLLINPLTAPLRADMAAYRAQQALDRLDYQAAGDELLRAIDLQPRNGSYAEGMALVYEESGLYTRAFEERVRGALLQPGNAYAALIAGKTAAHIGRLGDAEDWYRLAAIYEPNGAEVLAESAAFLSKVGRVERARELLNVFEALQSTNLGAWESARDAYQTLGELEMVDRANLCSIHLQKGCWNHGG